MGYYDVQWHPINEMWVAFDVDTQMIIGYNEDRFALIESVEFHGGYIWYGN